MINSACGPDLSHPLDIYFDALPALSYAQSIENDHVFSLTGFGRQVSFVIWFTGDSLLSIVGFHFFSMLLKTKYTFQPGFTASMDRNVNAAA